MRQSQIHYFSYICKIQLTKSDLNMPDKSINPHPKKHPTLEGHIYFHISMGITNEILEFLQ